MRAWIAALGICVVVLITVPGAWAQEFLWARRLGGTANDQGYGVAVDAAGNVYTSGSFQGTADFDPGSGVYNLTSAGGQATFISKLDRAGNFVWAKQLGGVGASVHGGGVAVDAAGNVYTVGDLTGTADFNPGPGTHFLTSTGQEDVFISKLDSAGDFVWAIRLGGTGFLAGYRLALAGTDVYVVGEFGGTADFDPGSGISNMTGAGVGDIFIAKLDNSGSFGWAVQMGGPDYDAGAAVAVDAAGNVYTTGYFAGTADFDPGASTFNLTSAGLEDVFISKLNSQGGFVWAKQLGGPGSDLGDGDVTVDGIGNVYATGSFKGTADFDPGSGNASLTSAGFADVYVTRLDSGGNLVWARRSGGPGSDWGAGVAVDKAGNTVVVGGFHDTVDFDPSPGIHNLTARGGEDVFVWKLDSAGDFVKARQLGGGGEESTLDVTLDPGGTVYLVGRFQGTIDLDPGPVTYNLTAAGLQDVFISKLGSTYAALGDSYSSGEGLIPFNTGTESSCHRSRQAYPYQVKFPWVSVADNTFIACTGAVTDNVRPGGTGQFNGPTQLNQTYADDPGTRIVNDATLMVSLTVGGDDMTFADVLTTCFFNCPMCEIGPGCLRPNASCESDDCRPFGQNGPSLHQYLTDLLPVVQANVTNVYRCVKARAPNAAVIALNYPKLFATQRKLVCGADVGFNSNERAYLNSMAQELDDALASAGSAAGVQSVDVMADFANHEVCSTAAWIDGVNAQEPTWSFHPNSLGQANYARIVNRYVFTSTNPRLPSGLPANPPAGIEGQCDPALEAMSLGAGVGPNLPLISSLTVEAASSTPCDSHGAYVPGQNARVRGVGFSAGGSVDLLLAADEGRYVVSLGSIQADASGSLDAIVGIPPAVPTLGPALVQARGVRGNGGSLLLAAEIRLSTSFATDQDSDGVSDPCDNCPLVANTDQHDIDGDGLGAQCDPCPNDPENDVDQDGLCADVDPCPLDVGNDADADGRCEPLDNCPAVENAVQADTDGDGFGDACDCAPVDPGSGAVPSEALGLAWDLSDDRLTWDSLAPQAGSQVFYDVIWGALTSLPVGSGVDHCAASGIAGTAIADPSPALGIGSGVWFNVRGRNTCGVGSYGYQSNGVERISGACP